MNIERNNRIRGRAIRSATVLFLILAAIPIGVGIVIFILTKAGLIDFDFDLERAKFFLRFLFDNPRLILIAVGVFTFFFLTMALLNAAPRIAMRIWHNHGSAITKGATYTLYFALALGGIAIVVAFVSAVWTITARSI